MIGMGYYGTHHAAGDPAQRPGEPRLVHRLHALPGRDRARAGSRRCSTSRRWSRDLTGLDVANASLLDEATAAAEAMTHGQRRRQRASADGLLRRRATATRRPSTWCATRAEPLGIEVVVGDPARRPRPAGGLRRARCSIPATDGAVLDYARADRRARTRAGALVVVATDLLALTLLTPPGELGADIAVGIAQRFGVPLGYGGPHAAFFATRDEYKRAMPGRLIGVSSDAHGRTGAAHGAADPRAAHPPREGDQQHLHRAGAARGHGRACTPSTTGPRACGDRRARARPGRRSWRAGLRAAAASRCAPTAFFDTVRVRGAGGARAACARGARRRHEGSTCAWSTPTGSASRSTRPPSAADVWRSLLGDLRRATALLDDRGSSTRGAPSRSRPGCAGQRRFLTHPVFNSHHSETEMLRYMRAARVARPRRSTALDDPARLVHDEAERDRRDDAGHLAGVRRRSTRSRRPSRPTATGSCSRELEAMAGARSPASPPSRCSPTPARRANTPACW